MSKIPNKEMITERSDNMALKSNLSKNIPMDLSQNSLLSSDVGKKASDHKTNEIKQLNLTTERSINKKIRKQIENDSLHSFDNFDNDIPQKKKIDKNKKKQKTTETKIIVDDIENIYSNLVDKTNKMYSFQKVFLLTIAFFVNVCHWIFAFLAKTKLENNYCFTKLNQFDNCISSQICSNLQEQINIFLYNFTFDVHNNSLTEHQNFIEEMNYINEYYKHFFVSHNYQISKDKLLSSIDMIKFNGNKLNFAIILAKKERWNIFLQFSSLCQMENSYFYNILIIIIGGILGSLLFGLLADIYGRKKLIVVLLFIITLSFAFFAALSLKVELKYDYYLKEYDEKYYAANQTHYNILSTIYSQQYTSKYFEGLFPVFLFSLLLISLALRPLGKICLSLLLENSVSELKVLENFRRYTFFTTGLPPFFTFLIFIIVNNFITSIIIMASFFFIFFICSIFLLNESMRYHYEYSEWRELTDEINHLFYIKDDITLNYKNKIQFEAFRIEENRKMLGNLTKKINSVFDLAKQRIIYLNRDIRRNSSFIIKKEEVKFNPLIIYTSISANRVFIKLRALMAIILIIIYAQVLFVEKEIVDIPFFNISDLYVDTHNNIIINSNYFFLALITLISNFFFYMCYRISCFKLIFYFSLIAVTLLLVLYHFVTYQTSDYPLDLNQTNFFMLQLHSKKNRIKNINVLLLVIHFFLNGINFYINLLVIKLTKTLYRCSLFGINTCLSLLAFAFGESLTYQIEHYFLLIGALNLIGIVSEFYFGELKGVPNLINDLKQNINRENNKNKEKNKRL